MEIMNELAAKPQLVTESRLEARTAFDPLLRRKLKMAV
jgi:hypothetical protein